MRITIITAGKLKERYLREGVSEYLKRLVPFAKTEIVELSEEQMPEAPSKLEKEKALLREGERLLRSVPKDSYLTVLDLYGDEYSSEEFASRLAARMNEGKSRLSFVIGGPFGISDAVRAAADELLSLSRLTFTHQMARLLLVEQIYRAFKICRGEKYHW